jgi:hypothetical protein
MNFTAASTSFAALTVSLFEPIRRRLRRTI